MIWFRRTAAVFLAIIFVILFVASLVLFRVNDTALNARFYTEQLRKADTYNFVHQAALPAALDKAAADTSDPPVDITVVKADALKVFAQTFPPDWLQAQLEQTIYQVVPYMVGDKDRFSVTVPLSDRVDIAARALKDSLRNGNTYNSVYNSLTDQAADEALKNIKALPVGLTLTKNDLLSAIRSVAPKAWVEAQMENAIDQVTPWLKGTTQHFTITVPLTDRVDAAGQAVKDLAKKGNVSSFVFDNVVKEVVNNTVQNTTNLPYGAAVSRDEVMGVMKQILPQTWIDARFNDVLDSSVAYLTNKTNTLTVTIPMADRRDVAYQSIATLFDQKLQARIDSLPQCDLQTFTNQLRTLPPGQLPTCKPATITYAQIKQTLGVDTVTVIRQVFKDQIPDTWTFGESDLRSIVGDDTWQQVQDARKNIKQGYTFTDADLRSHLSADARQNLDDVLKYTKQGATFTQADLRTQLLKGSDGEDTLDNLEQARSSLHTLRQWLWALWPVMGVMLAGIGLLGGRTMGSKIAWAAVVLLIAALLAFIAFGPVYSSTASHQIKTEIDNAIRDAQMDDPTMVPVVTWATKLGKSAVDSFAGGIRNRAVLFLVIGIAGGAAGVGLHVTRGKKGPEKAKTEKPPKPRLENPEPPK